MNDIIITGDVLGQKYTCAICGYSPSRIDCHIKGWGKMQHLKKLIKDHIDDCHLKNKEIRANEQ